MRSVLALALALGLLSGIDFQGCVRLAPPPWPEWVLRHWVWENEGDQTSALALADDYLARDIPVGAQIIDRPWEVEVTSFEPDPRRYPDMGGLVEALHQRDIRVFLWAVSIINQNAPSFQEAKDRGFLLAGGALVDWWAGRGAFLDYTNPEAVTWWHGLMDRMLDLGIDGWKCDGTDPFIVMTNRMGAAGLVTLPQYQDAYYRDFFEYTRARLGPDRVITARPVDGLGLDLDLPYAPRDVNFAGWVGDQDGSFTGMQQALQYMRYSAARGYVNFGSDIGGFRGSGLRDRELFVRWAQLGALSPIMENGGGGEHRPWRYDAEVTDIYRRFVKLHHELIPYLYSQGARAWEDGVSLMRFRSEGVFHYLLGDDLFVAPILGPGGRAEVHFPPGRWIAWLDESQVVEGGTVASLDFDLGSFPVYVREGSLVPLDVRDASTGHGGAFAQGHLTVAVFPLAADPPVLEQRSFDVYEEKGHGVRLSSGQWRKLLVLRASPTARPLLFRVAGRPTTRRVEAAFGPSPVPVSSTADLASGPRTWVRDADGIVWIRIADAGGSIQLTVRP